MEEAVGENTAAVLLEPIQGENGVIVPPDGYLARVRECTDREGALLLFDEIQTGMGRCGTLFRYEEAGVVPDVMVLAKGLAGGLPMGACLAGEWAFDVLTPGSHASTFGGNPLVSTVAETVLRTIVEDGILENVREMGALLVSRLETLAKKFPIVREVRGRGLMVGMELSEGGDVVVEKMRQRRILINLTAERVLRFTPPLIVSRGDIEVVIDALREILREIS
jgi:acetylornithine aminotransferase